MTRRNRVDPWGDLHAVASRGLLTGNRGCVVDDHERVVRHHGSSLWIVCVTRFRDWRWPLARPRRWTPLFFLDDAVALAAGHRPCGECRHADDLAYREAVSTAVGIPLRAGDLNRRLAAERGSCAENVALATTTAHGRRTWTDDTDDTDLPDGTVVVTDGPRLVLGHLLF